jgi:hypothetical protein
VKLDEVELTGFQSGRLAPNVIQPTHRDALRLLFFSSFHANQTRGEAAKRGERR